MRKLELLAADFATALRTSRPPIRTPVIPEAEDAAYQQWLRDVEVVVACLRAADSRFHADAFRASVHTSCSASREALNRAQVDSLMAQAPHFRFPSEG